MERNILWILLGGIFVGSFLILFSIKDSANILPITEVPPPSNQEFVPDQWFLFVPEDDSFSVQFPTPPQQAIERGSDPITRETKIYHMYASEYFNGAVLMVSKVQFVDQPPNVDKHLLIQMTINEMLRTSEKNQLIEQTPVTLQNNEAVQFMIKNGSTEVKVTSIVDGNIVYSLIYASKYAPIDVKVYEYFIHSFSKKAKEST